MGAPPSAKGGRGVRQKIEKFNFLTALVPTPSGRGAPSELRWILY